LLTLLRNIFRPHKQCAGFVFSRPLVLLQSDDWGRVGVRDREGYEHLRAQGLRLGERPYDLYTLETTDDVNAVTSLLGCHPDSTGRRACMVLNTCTANFDFALMRKEKFGRQILLPLATGLPGKWARPGLLDSYRDGIASGVFFPAPHGMTHCCPVAIANALAEEGEHAQLLKLLWDAETPYIYWRMPWVGYEYLNPEKPKAGFLSLDRQRDLVTENCRNFNELFGVPAVSACAPGSRANCDTHRAWSESGIRVVQNGTGSGLRAPHFDEFGLLHLYRTLDFEPSHRELEIDKYLEIAAACFSRGIPMIISVHSINFHSTLKDFRSPTIAGLDKFLSALETKYPELLYVHDADLYHIVTEGAFQSHAATIKIKVDRREWTAHSARKEAF
jgi:hypothetical protein